MQISDTDGAGRHLGYRWWTSRLEGEQLHHDVATIAQFDSGEAPPLRTLVTGQRPGAERPDESNSVITAEQQTRLNSMPPSNRTSRTKPLHGFGGICVTSATHFAFESRMTPRFSMRSREELKAA